MSADRFRISSPADLEVDHLQFGFAVPTAVPVPGALLLLGSALTGLVGLRRRHG